VRVAFDVAADAKQLTKLEAGVLMAVAMFQPVTRGDISEMFGREISRDLIAGLREEGVIAAGPRSPKLGAPYAYVTTQKFLFEFGLESLRDLPDLGKNSRTQGFSDRRAEMSPDERGLPWKERRTKRPLIGRAFLPTSQAYLVSGAKRTSPKRMRLEARFRGRVSARPGGGRGWS
jgi:hypothetical protein